MTPVDLRPAAQRMADLLVGVRDDQLGDPTPCTDTSLGDMVDHVAGLCRAFTLAAAKDAGDGPPAQPPKASAANLEEGWRTEISSALAGLASAWADERAWEGMTTAAGVDLPAGVAGLFALDEVVVHGWDVARASGQPYDPDRRELEPLLAFLEDLVGSGGAPREGLFGPPVDVARDAPMLDRILGLTGREPGWPA